MAPRTARRAFECSDTLPTKPFGDQLTYTWAGDNCGMLDARRIWRYRSLLGVLTIREVKARYRGSALGFLWSLVNPVLLLVVYTFVFSLIFRPRIEGSQPYALFLISGLFPWIWISTSLLEGSTSLTANAGFIRKSVFPVELLPLVPVLSSGLNFVLSLPVIAVGLLAGRLMGFPVGGWTALLVPAVVALLLPFVGGLSLALAALTVHFKDVRDIVTNLLTLGFFLTPILYSLDSISHPLLRNLIRFNPFSPFILSMQQCLFAGQVPGWSVWLQMSLASLLAWLVGSWLFDRLSDTFAEAV